MAKIFWLSCPKCAGEFYCHAQELRHKKVPLLCPYCSHRFLDENSPKIVNRAKEDRRLGSIYIEAPLQTDR